MFFSFLKYYIPYKKVVIFIVIASFLTAALDLVFPILVRYIINTEIPNHNICGILSNGSLLLLIYMLNSLLIYFVNFYGHLMSIEIEQDMRRDLFEHLENMSFKYFDNNKTGELLSRLTSDLLEISELTFRGPNDVIVCLITMLGSICILLWINLYLGLLITALLLIKTVHTVIINKKMKASFRENRKANSKVTEKLSESLSGIRLIKSFANEEVELNNLMSINKKAMAVRKKSFKLLGYFSSSVNFFTNFTNLSILTVGGLGISYGKINLSDFIAFLLYINLFMKPLLRLTVFTEMYQRGMAGFNRFYEIMQQNPEIIDTDSSIDCKDIKGRLTFKDVSFAYEENKIIKNFNLEVAPGETVAFVGTTGAGKTTLVNLILRFYEPQEGKILIDNIDIRKYTQKTLRKQIGLVEQDVFLFSDSIKNNISYATKNASFQNIKSAAAAASIADFIETLPDKYDTQIGERGIKLSGGQKQRIAIARVFLKNPPIVIFDEATSALDNKTEKRIQNALNKLSKNRTTIIIAHRLSTIERADKIVVIENGAIVEVGTHKDLLKLKGVYFNLYNSIE